MRTTMYFHRLFHICDNYYFIGHICVYVIYKPYCHIKEFKKITRRKEKEICQKHCFVNRNKREKSTICGLTRYLVVGLCVHSWTPTRLMSFDGITYQGVVFALRSTFFRLYCSTRKPVRVYDIVVIAKKHMVANLASIKKAHIK